MPELPEVETIKKALESIVVGRTITAVDVFTQTLRSALDKKELNRKLKHKRILSLRRRAKYIFFDMPELLSIQVHLGMTGSFRVEENTAEVLKHDRVIFYLDNDEKLIYNDIRKFGEILLVELPGKDLFPARFLKYAPEPLGGDFTSDYLYSVLQKTKKAVKPALMEQQRVVGVGNIYASEALFAAKISPLRRADSINMVEVRRLHKEIKRVLLRSLELGGTTISDYKKPDGSEGKYALELKVYGRSGEKCLRRGCKGVVQKTVQTGRSTFFCDLCQK